MPRVVPVGMTLFVVMMLMAVIVRMLIAVSLVLMAVRMLTLMFVFMFLCHIPISEQFYCCLF